MVIRAETLTAHTMTAVILAAGVSSRLRPLTNSTPKALLAVGGKPLLQRSLEAIQQTGIQRCVIVTGYYHEKVASFVRSLDLELSLKLVFNRFFATTNNNYSLWLTKAEVAGQAMVLMDSDVLFNPRLLAVLRDAPFENALLMQRDHSLGDEEVKLELDRSGRVLRIGKEIEPKRAAGESVGIAKFSASATQLLFKVLGRRRKHNEFYEASFQELIDSGSHVYAVDGAPYPCMEIDTAEDLARAERVAAELPQ